MYKLMYSYFAIMAITFFVSIPFLMILKNPWQSTTTHIFVFIGTYTLSFFIVWLAIKIEESKVNKFLNKEATIQNELKNVLANIEPLPQRQDSLSSQVDDLIINANKFGLYDASDYLKSLKKIQVEYMRD